MKSYRSSSTFVTVVLLFHELLPFVQFFSAMLSHIWIKIGSMLPYEELQIKFDFCHGWPTFSWVIALFQNSFSQLFSPMLSHISMTVGSKLPCEELLVLIKFHFHHSWLTFSFVIALCSKFVFRTFLGYLWCTEIMVADLNLLGSVGDLYCFSNTHSKLVFLAWLIEETHIFH